MRIITTLILVVIPAISVAQRASDEFCENLETFESLSPDEYESLEQWGEEYLDAIFAGQPELPDATDELPENWLRYGAATQIADCYMTGRGTKRDIRKAMAVLEIPAKAGHGNSAHMLASMQVFRSNDPELQRRGFLALQEEAQAGSAYSAGKMGWAYAMGWGTEKDEQRALEQYFIAAKAGMTYWQYLLAHAYEQGYYGLPVDQERATYWREFEPKVHVTTYECEVAGSYERGLYPANPELQQKYRKACKKAR
jgi:TPR repeat protein